LFAHCTDATRDYSPTYVGMLAASKRVTAGSVDVATFGRASATVEWIDHGPKTRTKVAVIATAMMARIEVPLWWVLRNSTGRVRERFALGDYGRPSAAAVIAITISRI
jgi:hypothetical protein